MFVPRLRRRGLRSAESVQRRADRNAAIIALRDARVYLNECVYYLSMINNNNSLQQGGGVFTVNEMTGTGANCGVFIFRED